MKKLLLSFLCIWSVITLHAQGVTTSSINGLVKDGNNEALIGATILVKHTPTGAVYGTVTDENGAYRIANMKVGGPYLVEISYVGYATQTRDNVNLRLGEAQKLDFILVDEGIMMEELVVVATAGTIGQSSGASTQITTEAIDNMPTLNRDVSDFLRLTPQASAFGDGISFAGINNRFNAIYIDGAVNNDVFGLSSTGTNGGQTGASPFSIDIIDQFQVVLSPYDVSLGGFAGGGINAVTKSGTNQFKGTAYYFWQNENLVGKTNNVLAERLEVEREKLEEFDKRTYGASLGGPIIKDKVFFFVNAEIQDDVTPAPFEIENYTSEPDRASLDDLNALRDYVISNYDYDPGTFGSTSDDLDGLKLFGKIDINLNKNHKLTARHQYTKAEQYDRNSGSSTTLNFSNNGVYFPSTTNSSAVELNSSFGTSMANNLIIGYTSVLDDRGAIGGNFPYVIINDNGGQIRMGTEEFSTGNLLDQKILTLTNNFKLYKRKHTFTFGTHNEFYDIRNVFIRQNFGSYQFDSLNDFITGAPATMYDRSYSLAPGDERVIGDDSQAAAEFNAMQFGIYGQDQIEINNKLTITAGLRIDVPIITSDPAVDTSFTNTTLPLLQAQYDIAKEVEPGKAPDGQIMLSPRVGFEYLTDGSRNTVVRGGVGVFTSRIPFVWPGAMFNNNGLSIGSVDEGALGGTVPFVADVTNQYTNPDFAVPSGQMDLFVKDFKYPQVLRGNLALDKKVAGGWNFSIEGIYTKTLNNVLYTNVNSATAEEFRWTGTPDARIVYGRDRIDPQYGGDIYVGSNTSEGYSYNLTLSAAKAFAAGWNAMLSYTYGDAESLNDGTSSQNSSQWRGQVHTDNGRNNPVYGRSDYSAGSRLVGSLNYKVKWTKSGATATTFSLFYNGQSGEAFSYVIGGQNARNISQETGSTSSNRTLIYVPETAADINLVDYVDANGITVNAAEQWAELDALINDDKWLDKQRGGYAEKNGSRTPFEHNFDFAIRQDLGVLAGGRAHKFQLSLDIFNLANLLNKDWGARYFVPGNFNNYFLYQFEGYATDGTTPTFTYRDDRLGKDRFNISGTSSRWRMRLGVRYIFD
jgi:Carboxypeptidase regulatory-like domain/TonB-dependent Receptor Plug Domain